MFEYSWDSTAEEETPGGGDPNDQYARVLVELFDAIMSTLRWTQP